MNAKINDANEWSKHKSLNNTSQHNKYIISVPCVEHISKTIGPLKNNIKKNILSMLLP